MTVRTLSLGYVAQLIFAGTIALAAEPGAPSAAHIALSVPRLERPAVIDGDLNDWKDVAWNDGLWDLRRVQTAPWYESSRNRLTDHGNEPGAEEDLAARYFIAWDDEYLYVGAEVHDNVNDTVDPKHEAKRWYYKDAIAWFIEAPRDATAETFGEGNHGFAFVIDPTKPAYGAWWRHGTATKTYVEEPLPTTAVDYVVRMNPWGRSAGDFVLEARIRLSPTFDASDQKWSPPKEGDAYSLCIVHTDPDGGGYGGHLLLYGAGDDDSTWARAVLSGVQAPVKRTAK